jgi:aspartyl-tRNA(Asn)/glutamyl-tRNA(Gln) amidotransferase subunit B
MSAEQDGSAYEAVIGLEVHCQLATRSKIFCACPANPPHGVSVSEVAPNSAICPVCTGHPGTLPVLNRKAVEFAVRAGLAVGAKIKNQSLMARKNYFYPDLPRGYQLSQHDQPICEQGLLSIESGKSVRIRRIHLEEDAGKSAHEFGVTLVNLNRAGVPLIEIVTEPDLSSPGEAGEFLRELHALVVALGITHGNLQEGNFRCDANVSVRPRGATRLGTRVEIKNVNSFRFIEKALHFEIARQIAVVESGKEVKQETRLYDSGRDQTLPMRSKEEAEDYRYFTDPDLLPVSVSRADIEKIQSQLPELPAQKRQRWERELGLSRADAQRIVLDANLRGLFEAALSEMTGSVPSIVARLLVGEVSRLEGIKELSARHLADLGRALEAGQLSSTAAKKILGLAWEEGGEVAVLIEREGLKQVSGAAALAPIVEAVLAENPQALAELKAGKEKVAGFLVGQMMKRSGGKANPEVLKQLLKSRIQGG